PWHLDYSLCVIREAKTANRLLQRSRRNRPPRPPPSGKVPLFLPQFAQFAQFVSPARSPWSFSRFTFHVSRSLSHETRTYTVPHGLVGLIKPMKKLFSRLIPSLLPF